MRPYNQEDQRENLKILREIGFKPYVICWHKDHLCEIVSFPFFDKAGDRDPQIHIRLEIGDPTSMEKVPCSEIHTVQTLEDQTVPMTAEALRNIALAAGYRDMTTQPGAFRL